MNTTAQDQNRPRLVLCFDGTGNQFNRSSGDTNVAKIMRHLDRNAPKQHHYYQTGIGTYDINEKSVNKSRMGQMKNSVSQTIDQGLGTSFDQRVMAAYRFLMEYYESGAKIYMLGFSRGAFIAKFLTNMICTVGLLCKGNTSMVPLAYRLYQDFVKSAATHRNCKMCPEPTKKKRRDSGYEGNDHESDHKRSKLCDYQQKKRRIDGFKETFCRMEYETDNTKLDDNKDIQVYFLGLWDCVNSVAVLQGNSILPQAESDLGEAKYVRHAVSIDENRVQFRAALFQQSYPGGHGINPENLQEVWFPGDHADVGGGWPANGAKFLTSDISLAWMIREMKLIDKNEGDSALQWYEKSISKFKARFDEGMDRVEKKKDLPRLHNTHNLWDAGLFMFIFWWIMECMPIAHWELERTRWVNSRWPNLAGTRDIPSHVFLHNSVKRRLVNDPQYRPSNNRGGNLPPCLRSENLLEAEKSVNLQYDDTDRFHRLWRLAHRS